MYGTIKTIEEVHNFSIAPVAPTEGDAVRLGLGQMINMLGGRQVMEGYKVITDKHTFLVLIDSQASCCESFGYISSDDDLQRFVGTELQKVEATDVSCFKKPVEEFEYLDEGGVQFVDFVTNKGMFQLAVYNGHNGYYGHGVILAQDDKILLNKTI